MGVTALFTLFESFANSLRTLREFFLAKVTEVPQ